MNKKELIKLILDDSSLKESSNPDMDIYMILARQYDDLEVATVLSKALTRLLKSDALSSNELLTQLRSFSYNLNKFVTKNS